MKHLLTVGTTIAAIGNPTICVRMPETTAIH
jgi:hypothetical protein